MQYSETVSEDSNLWCLSEAPNEHNRLYTKSRPFLDSLAKDTDQRCPPARSSSNRPQTGQEVWVRRGRGPKPAVPWALKHPPHHLPNITKGAQYLNEMGTAWRLAYRGRFDIRYLTLHVDPFRASPRPALPLCRADLLPRPVGPLHLWRSDVRNRAWWHRGGPEQEAGPRLRRVPGGWHPHACREGPLASWPTWGLTRAARPSSSWHLQTLLADPFDHTSRPSQAVGDMWKHTGLKEGIPAPDNFHDRLEAAYCTAPLPGNASLRSACVQPATHTTSSLSFSSRRLARLSRPEMLRLPAFRGPLGAIAHHGRLMTFLFISI